MQWTLNKTRRSGALMAAITLLLSGFAQANVITYQGVLSDAGAGFTGTAQMSFSLYDDALAGTEVWTETHGSVAVVNGSFAVLLGSVTPFGSTFENHSGLFLEVSADVGAGLQGFSPRVPFSAAPYALMATRAQSAATADHATTADSATTALSANTATTADSATTADHATTADSATTAQSADTATAADFATTAGSATTADSATTAQSADTATTADFATTAGSATTADSATTATTADTATTALSADSVDWTGIQNVPSDLADGGNAATLNGFGAGAFALSAHTHAATDIVSGVLDFLRLPVGTGANQVAAGNHTHNASAITAGTLDFARLPVGTGATQVSQGDHRHTNLPYFIGQLGGELTGNRSIATQEASGITNNGNTLTAPVTGRYWIHAQQLYQTGANATYFSMTRNDGILVYAYMTGNGFWDLSVSRLVSLNAGDFIRFRVDGPSPVNVWGGVHSSVTMYLVH